ncbi:MAG: hypothetical protein FWH22_01910 [Fibromonadales bacterium]|nr:hypothetical protein [Fibromonadales bacterium]
MCAVCKNIQGTAQSITSSLLLFGCTPLPNVLPRSARLDEWLHRGFNADMSWMAKNAEVRKHPANFNGKAYNTAWVGLWKYPRPLQKKQEPIAAFAHGKDYHITVGSILRELAAQVNGQPFVDSLPIAERELAAMAGLGFIGKNTMLINQKLGSAFFIGGILLYSQFSTLNSQLKNNGCAKCKKCIDACPNKALIEDGFLDAHRCASYLTIEHKGEFSEEQKEWAKHSIFGCDICQRVCPYNAKHLAEESEPCFLPIKETPLKRAGFKKLTRNHISKNFYSKHWLTQCN